MSELKWLHFAIGGLIAFAGLAIVAGVLAFGRGDVRSYIDDRYALVKRDGRSAEYSSTSPPTKVASDIAGKWKPADRLTDPAGIFLRYRSDFVAVTADSAGGSHIYVDDERRGYARWYPFVGGYWGTYSAPGDGIRGGGPGAGK